MKENDLFMQEALGYLDPGLLEESGKATAKKRRPAPVRALMAAACICALLIIGAVAVAEVIGVQVGPILSGNELLRIDPSENPEDYSGYAVTGHVEGFSWDNVSAELKAEAEKQEDTYTAFFGSQAELEAALGFTLPDNPVLDAAQESKGHYQPAGSEKVIHTFGKLWILLGNDGKVDSLHVWTNYAVSNPEHVTHKVYIPITEEERENGVVSSYFTCTGEVSVIVEYVGQESEMAHYYSYKDVELSQEDYVTPNGVKTVIIREDLKTPALIEFDEGYQSYKAHLVVDGMALAVHVDGNENCADVKGVLKSILDAYQ